MNGGARRRSEEMKEEETGRPAGTVTALTSSDLVPSLNLGRVGTNLNVTMGSEAPGAVSVAAPRRHLCQTRNTRSPTGGKTPSFVRGLCN